ncbi:hypothetical protein GCM10009736_39710 [Actinomadura bangladeshensis]
MRPGVVAAMRLAVALVQLRPDMPGVRPRERDPPVDKIHAPILADGRRAGTRGAAVLARADPPRHYGDH